MIITYMNNEQMAMVPANYGVSQGTLQEISLGNATETGVDFCSLVVISLEGGHYDLWWY